MNTKIATLALLAACAVGTGAQAMTKDEYKAQKDSIEANYKAAHDRCKEMKANAKDVCISEAKGHEKVAKAELEAQYKPSPKADANVREAKADATYDTAKEKCNDLAGNAKTACVADAKSAFTSAMASSSR